MQPVWPIEGVELDIAPTVHSARFAWDGSFVMQVLLGFTVNGDALNLRI